MDLGTRQDNSENIPEKNIIMGTTLWTGGLDAPGTTHLHWWKRPCGIQKLYHRKRG